MRFATLAKLLTLCTSAGLLVACPADDGGFERARVRQSAVADVASSTARVATSGDYLYVADVGELVTVDISDPEAPREVGRLALGELINDLLAVGDLLLVTTDVTRHSYLLGPGGLPVLQADDARFGLDGDDGTVTRCDPVAFASPTLAFAVVNDDTSGDDCRERRDGLARNELIALDLSDRPRPRPLAIVNTPAPTDVATAGEFVFVATDLEGGEVFRFTAAGDLTRTGAWRHDLATDVLARDSTVYSISRFELIRYRVSPAGQLLELDATEL